jgi:DNA-binding MarR family transcriptional regulator
MSACVSAVVRAVFSRIVHAVNLPGDKSRWCMEMCAAFYAHLLSIVPGSTSVNELRVLTAIGLATLKNEHIGITELATQLHIPLSTASRIVANLTDNGSVISVRHPRDDRRKTLQLSSRHRESLAEWAQGWFSIRERLAEAPAK